MHQYKLRVYYEDTDAQGVVYYANYLKFFERARTELLRTAGYEQQALLEAGAIFIVRDLDLFIQKPARLDDEIAIKTKLIKLGKVIFNKKLTRVICYFVVVILDVDVLMVLSLLLMRFPQNCIQE
jgi:acyl-CoA thioester hydrolase